MPNEGESVRYLSDWYGRTWDYGVLNESCLKFVNTAIEKGGGKVTSDGSRGENPRRYPRDARDGYKKQVEDKKKKQTSSNDTPRQVTNGCFSPRFMPGLPFRRLPDEFILR